MDKDEASQLASDTADIMADVANYITQDMDKPTIAELMRQIDENMAELEEFLGIESYDHDKGEVTLHD
jgi:hypothetical protein